MKKFISAVLSIAALLSAACLPAYAEDESVQIDEYNVSFSGDCMNIDIPTLSDHINFTSSGLKRASSLPSAYDSRDYDIVTSVKNQANTGTCWAHAAMAALESSAVSQDFAGKDDVNFSESHLAWYAWTAETDSSDPNAGENFSVSAATGNSSLSAFDVGGNWMVAGIALNAGEGIADDSDFPLYKNGKVLDSSAFGYENRYNTGSGYALDEELILSSLSEIKQWIMKNGACTLSFYYSSENADTVDGESTYCSAGGESNHAVTVVGWDDSFPASSFKNSPSSDGAFLIKDSWGICSHNEGYFWISYYDSSISGIAGYKVRKADDAYKTYSYNAAIETASVSATSSRAFANVFKSEGYENLNSVSVLTLQTALTVNVKIYTLSSKTSKPDSGKLQATMSEYCGNAGFNRINLDTPVSLKPGQYYSVVVSFTPASGTSVSVPVEYMSNTNGVVYTRKQYTSYIKASASSSFSDTYGTQMGNFYINATTSCGHNWATEEKVSATCTEDGSAVKTCTQCGKTEDVTLPAIGSHTEYVSLEAVPATCSAEGRTQEIRCSVCGEILEASEVIPVNDVHSEIYSVEEDGNGGSGYYSIVSCADCGKVLSTTHFDTSVVSTSTSRTYVSGETDRGSSFTDTLLYIIRLIAYTLSLFK